MRDDKYGARAAEALARRQRPVGRVCDPVSRQANLGVPSRIRIGSLAPMCVIQRRDRGARNRSSARTEVFLVRLRKHRGFRRLHRKLTQFLPAPQPASVTATRRVRATAAYRTRPIACQATIRESAGTPMLPSTNMADRMPSTGVTRHSGTRKGRDRCGCRRRSTISAAQTVAKAIIVPVEISSPSRLMGNIPDSADRGELASGCPRSPSGGISPMHDRGPLPNGRLAIPGSYGGFAPIYGIHGRRRGAP